MKRIDETGNVHGRWTVISYAGLDKRGRAQWNCLCACGVQSTVDGTNLRSGDSTSCGECRMIIPKEVRSTGEPLPPGHRYRVNGKGFRSAEMSAWSSAKDRIFNKNSQAYADYGGRGLTMDLDLAQSFPAWLRETGLRPSPEHSIDRWNNELGYVKGNIRYATHSEQNRNRRSHGAARRNAAEVVIEILQSMMADDDDDAPAADPSLAPVAA